MQNYDELVEYARLFWQQSQSAQTKECASILQRMAKQYQKKAADLSSGELPDLSAQ